MTEEIHDLLDRLRAKLDDDPNIAEKKMFGGIAFMLNGNMLCGISSKGHFMARVGKELEAEALKRPGASEMRMTGRKMGGVLFVDEDAIQEDGQLEEWIALCTRFVGALPAK